MGDRSMAEIRMVKSSLYIYAHWDGAGLPHAAEKAIFAAKGRLNDEPYGVRIIVDQLTKAARDQEAVPCLLLGPDSEDSPNNDAASVIIDLTRKTLTVIDRTGRGTITEKGFREIVELAASTA